ncbi:MAG TPA: SOS response-associated peptidase [Burkholderiales bacterium]|nr:SOS response-associated peptidase [Burkholderiales bacterium]
MCGRFDYHHSIDQAAKAFGVDADRSRPLPSFTPSYNIAPSQPAVVGTCIDSSARVLMVMSWGLLPHWADPAKLTTRPINARAETAHQLPMFRSSFKSKRCLIAADGFYEWKQTPTGKMPHYIALAGGETFAFAGLWDAWQPKDGGDPVYTCTILTTEPNEFMAEVHNRMPAILKPDDYSEWLDPTYQNVDGLMSLISSGRAPKLRAWPVSKLVNSPKNNNRKLIEPMR